MSENGTIDVEARDKVLLIGINREQKRNSLTPDMLFALADALDRLEDTADLNVGLIYGVGPNFSAGLDLARSIGMMTGREGRRPITGIDPLQLNRRCTKPLVAAVRGYVFTAALEIVLSCDIVVAANNAEFGQLEPTRGIIPQGGATVRWVQRTGWGNAMYHLLRSDKFNTDEAYRIGLAQEVVEPDEVFDRALELAKEIAENAPIAIRETKKSALRYLAEGEAATFSGLNWTQERLSTTKDAMEGLQSFLEKRPPKFTGT